MHIHHAEGQKKKESSIVKSAHKSNKCEQLYKHIQTAKKYYLPF